MKVGGVVSSGVVSSRLVSGGPVSGRAVSVIYIASFRPVRATLRPCLKHDKIKHSMPAQTALSGSLIVTVVSVRCV